MNPPTPPLIPAITAKNDSKTNGDTRINEATKTVPTALAIAEAPIQQPAQHAFVLRAEKKRLWLSLGQGK